MSRPSKPVSASKTILSSQMMPVDANPMGNVHGGTILKLVDEAAGVTALRHSRTVVVTASIDRMDFYHPVYVVNLLSLKASVNYAGTISMKTDSQSKSLTSSLRHLKRSDDGERESSAEPSASRSYNTEKRKPRHRSRSGMKVAIIGFGMMGRQIAQVFAQHGHEVEVTDEDQRALKIGIDEIANGPYGIHSSVSKGKLTLEQASGSLARIKTSPKLDDVCKNSDLVIEAAFEDLRLKQDLFQKIEFAAPPAAIIASNTSTLSLDKISQKISKRDRALGMHFFNPAQLTKLVEIIRGPATSPETVEKGSRIVREIGKIPVLAQDEPGFIANRLGLTLYMEASKLLEDGIASLQDIDTCMKLG